MPSIAGKGADPQLQERNLVPGSFVLPTDGA